MCGDEDHRTTAYAPETAASSSPDALALFSVTNMRGETPRDADGLSEFFEQGLKRFRLLRDERAAREPVDVIDAGVLDDVLYFEQQ